MALKRRTSSWVWLAVFGLASGLPAQMIPADAESNPLRSLAFVSERLAAGPRVVPVQEIQSVLPSAVRDGWASFQLGAGGEWAAYVDLRTGQIESLVGSGIPWKSGDLNVLESAARSFLPRVAPLLGVDARSLVLNRERSSSAGSLWRVSFDVLRGGSIVEGARVTFTVSHGNLIQLGVENLPSPGAVPPKPRFGKEEALQILARHAGGFSSADTFLDGGSYHVIPVAVEDPRFPEGFEVGRGRGLAGVWQFLFEREGVTGLWRGRVDAVTGELLELVDVTDYAYVNGGVMWQLNQILRPMPFADLSIPGVTDSSGVYIWPGPPPGGPQTITSILDSTYVRINDYCGAISQAAVTGGAIEFGFSPASDCSTPGNGGPGNTRAARTQFYHLNRAKEIGRGWLPFNSWLSSKLTAVVNRSDATCAAGWAIAAVFYKSGNGCANSGEIEGVSLHEYAHGLDYFDGNGTSADRGTGETYGDFTATLMTHDSCVGRGFRPGNNCGGYGDPCTSCDGVRDIDFAQRASGVAHTAANHTQPLCPANQLYTGPCGREGHCESYVASEALWDFAERDMPSSGSIGAWGVAERLWYLSRPSATRAFLCYTGTPVWTSDGCGAGTYWREMRAVDDDDGNLANGTPHGGALFAAFDRHQMACATDPGANVTFAACAPPAAPAVSVTPGFDRMEIAWSGAGAGMVYDVYRNDLGCDAGFAKVADDVTGTSWTDNATANAIPYFYYVLAHPAGQEACSSAPSQCVTRTSARLFDVFTKDLAADVGLEPDPALAGQPMWTSPDIWVRNTNTAGPHQNPEYGQVNYVNVAVRNRGASAATAVPVEVYYANASTGLAWPTDWTLIGTATVATLAPGSTTNAVLPWSPPSTGHFCLLSRIATPSDPITHAEAADIDANTRLNNNLAWRNVNVVNLALSPVVDVELIFRNPDRKARKVRLLFREAAEHGGFLKRGRIVVDIGERLARRLEEQGTHPNGFRRLGPSLFEVADPAKAWLDVELEGREEHAIRMTFEDRAASHREKPSPAAGEYTFEVVEQDLGTGEEVGGVAYLIRAPGKE